MINKMRPIKYPERFSETLDRLIKLRDLKAPDGILIMNAVLLLEKAAGSMTRAYLWHLTDSARFWIYCRKTGLKILVNRIRGMSLHDAEMAAVGYHSALFNTCAECFVDAMELEEELELVTTEGSHYYCDEGTDEYPPVHRCGNGDAD